MSVAREEQGAPAGSQRNSAPISRDPSGRRKIWLAVAALLGAGVLAAVIAAITLSGSGITLPEGGNEPLSREELAAELNAICAEYFQRPDPEPAPSSLDEIAAFIEDEAIPNAKRGIADMRTLKPPDELEETFREFLLTLDVYLRFGEEALAEVKQGNISAFYDLGTRGQANTDRANELARELGADTCAEE